MLPHEFHSLYDILTRGSRNRPAPHDWYRDAERTMAGNPIVVAQARSEAAWCAERRPYYTVYPVAQDALSRVKLDVPCSVVRLPLPALLVRFMQGYEPRIDGRVLRCILAAKLAVRRDEEGMGVWCDFGERGQGPVDDVPIYSFVSFSLAGERTIDEAIHDLDYIERDSESTAVADALRYVIGVCLLGEDSELVDPDILSKDRIKWDDAKTVEERQAIIDRAQRRGKRGWLIGAHIDVAPHMRRPHVGLRWTGEGRRQPKIVPISGSIVRRKRVSEVPTGYVDYDCAECKQPGARPYYDGLCERCCRKLRPDLLAAGGKTIVEPPTKQTRGGGKISS